MVCLAHLLPAMCSEPRKFSEQGLERVETRENAGRRAKGWEEERRGGGRKDVPKGLLTESCGPLHGKGS